MLAERLSSELKEAMKAGEAQRVELLRGLLAALHNKEIEKRAPLNDEEAVKILRGEAKKRSEAKELYIKGGRKDLADKEEAEFKMIQVYLPAQMDRGQIEKLVDEARAQGASDFNTLIKEVMQRSAGQADGKLVSEIIKQKLGG